MKQTAEELSTDIVEIFATEEELNLINQSKESMKELLEENFDLLNRLIALNKTAIEESWKMNEVGEQFFKTFAYNPVK